MVTQKNRDRRFIEQTVQLAKDNEHELSTKLCAIIAIRNKWISTGFNSKKSHPFQATFAKNEEAIYIHAETSSIHKSLREIPEEDLRRATLYVGRVKGKDNSRWGLAKPCEGCFRAIKHYGIKRIVFTLDGNGEFEELIL